jgi:uncharacterized protein with GYD domain
MDTYVVLLKRMADSAGRAQGERPTPELYNDLVAGAGVELGSVFMTAGVFDAVLVCRAASNQAVARLLDGLAGWYADCMIATQVLGFESAPRQTSHSQSLGETSSTAAGPCPAFEFSGAQSSFSEGAAFSYLSSEVVIPNKPRNARRS